jgi:hypothetical protein
VAGFVYVGAHLNNGIGPQGIYRFDPALQTFSLFVLDAYGGSLASAERLVEFAGSVAARNGPDLALFDPITAANAGTIAPPPDHQFAESDRIRSKNGVLHWRSAGAWSRYEMGTFSVAVPNIFAGAGAYLIGLPYTQIEDVFFDASGAHCAVMGVDGSNFAYVFGTYLDALFSASSPTLGASCGSGAEQMALTSSPPVLGSSTLIALTGGFSNSVGIALAGGAPPFPLFVGACEIFVDPFTANVFPITTSATGSWSATIVSPPAAVILAGLKQRWQAAVFGAGGIQISNGLDWTFGF